MANLLKDHSFFKNYRVIVAAGDAVGCGAKALPPVNNAINYKGANPLDTKTITLSCGKLTTGVTIAPWTGIFILRNTNTPETYFQAAFRVQSPWKNGNKRECYIFDFAPDRALEQVKNYCDKMNPKGEINPKENLRDFIKYLPILVYNNAEMQEIDAEYILTQLIPPSLAKDWSNSSLIKDNLNTINSDLVNIIMAINGSKGPKKDDKLEINKSECLKKPSGSGNDNLEINEEGNNLKEKDFKKIREHLQTMMTKIPLYLYLSSKKEQTIKDLLECDEPELFQKIIGLSINDFSQLVKLDIFNSNLLTYMIYNFAKIEEESENYF